MCYVVISTSLRSNLFTEWNYLAGIPWMTATLWDFYANVLCIFIWIAYKENKMIMKITWLVLLVCLGSIATTGYLLKELFRLKDGESLKDLFVKQNN
jgi:hypothetical protein